MRKLAITALLIAGGMFAAPAQAAQTLVISGPSGIFGDTGIGCGVGEATPCSFTRTFSFATPTGYNVVSLDVSSILSSAATDINFTTVTFNGVAFNNIASGIQEFRNLLMQGLRTDGTDNVLVVSGTTGGAASFSGNLSFSQAVPEPGTWGLMLLGFGAVGASMRRRRARAIPALA